MENVKAGPIVRWLMKDIERGTVTDNTYYWAIRYSAIKLRNTNTGSDTIARNAAASVNI